MTFFAVIRPPGLDDMLLYGGAGNHSKCYSSVRAITALPCSFGACLLAYRMMFRTILNAESGVYPLTESEG